MAAWLGVILLLIGLALLIIVSPLAERIPLRERRPRPSDLYSQRIVGPLIRLTFTLLGIANLLLGWALVARGSQISIVLAITGFCIAAVAFLFMLSALVARALVERRLRQ
jgi:hypothetical protein